MATARDVVTRALRKRKALTVGETPQADELTDGLSDLNDMLFGWDTDGIRLGHITLAADDTLDVPDDHIQTIVLSLAERLTDYGGQLDPADIIAADDGRKRLRARYLDLIPLTVEHRVVNSRLNPNTW